MPEPDVRGDPEGIAVAAVLDALAAEDYERAEVATLELLSMIRQRQAGQTPPPGAAGRPEEVGD